MINKNEIEEIICQYKEEVIIQLEDGTVPMTDTFKSSLKGKSIACDKILDRLFIKMNKNIEEHARLHNQ